MSSTFPRQAAEVPQISTGMFIGSSSALKELLFLFQLVLGLDLLLDMYPLLANLQINRIIFHYSLTWNL